MAFTIRDGVPADLATLQGVFERASLSNAGDRGLLKSHPQWLVLADTGVRDGRVRVAVDPAGRVVGFATCLIADGVAELEDLFVDPSAMRRGVGTALVLDTAERLRARQYPTLAVTANPHALAFYEALGFVGDGLVATEGYPAPRMHRPTG